MKKIMLMIACCFYNALQASQVTKTQAGCPEEVKLSQEEKAAAKKMYELLGSWRMTNARLQELQEILQKYPRIVNGEEGETPLMFALKAGPGFSKAVKMLIDAGANVNNSGIWVSPLMRAAEIGNKENILLLLHAGSDPNYYFVNTLKRNFPYLLKDSEIKKALGKQD